LGSAKKKFFQEQGHKESKVQRKMQGLPKHGKKTRFALKIQEIQKRLEEKKE
jgi:hypothetical protein